MNENLGIQQNKQKPTTPIDLNPLMKDFRELIDKNGRGIRKILNQEKADVFPKDPKFREEIQNIREKLCITNLEPEKDIINIDQENVGSDWLQYTASEEERKKFNAVITKLLHKYELGLNFKDWMECTVLYGDFSLWSPLYDFDLFEQLISNPEEARRIPLTTAEKKYLKQFFRKILNVSRSGLLPKKYKTIFSDFCKILNLGTNSRRRMRSFDLAVKTLKHGEVVEHIDTVTQEKTKGKIAHSIIVSEIDIPNEKDSHNAEKKLIQNSRKQKERLLKRFRKSKK